MFLAGGHRPSDGLQYRGPPIIAPYRPLAHPRLVDAQLCIRMARRLLRALRIRVTGSLRTTTDREIRIGHSGPADQWIVVKRRKSVSCMSTEDHRPVGHAARRLPPVAPPVNPPVNPSYADISVKTPRWLRAL